MQRDRSSLPRHRTSIPPFISYTVVCKFIRFSSSSTSTGPSNQPLLPQVLSKCSGRTIRMPRRFVDHLPGSSALMAHMPKKQPRTQRVPSPPHDTYPLSDHSESQDGLLSISHPAARLFETEPDSMGLYRVYPTRPTLFPPDDSHLISLGNCRGRGPGLAYS